jgi:tRNA G18 (ribose-2'-O)-methylase SpoU
MPWIRIESPDDPRIAPYVDLPDRQLRARQGRFIAEGELVVQRLLESRFTVESLLGTPGRLEHMSLPADVPAYCASPQMMESVAGFRFHRGILACGIRASLADWSTYLRDREHEAPVVVCSAVRDPQNLGVILRNCAAFGTKLVLLGDHCADPLSRRVLRVSMAAALKLTVSVSDDLRRDLLRLHEEFHMQCVAAAVSTEAQPLSSTPRPPRVAIVLGNELDGLHPDTLRQCQTCCTIPMSSGTDSLNVAVASGIFLYHFTAATPWRRPRDTPPT